MVGAPPEVREEQPRQGTARTAGPVNGGRAMLELRTSPGRVDWMLVPNDSDNVTYAAQFPNVGTVIEVTQLIDAMLFEKAAQAYDVPRFAVGIVALHPSDNRDASYAELTELLKSIRPNLDGASDFSFQVCCSVHPRRCQRCRSIDCHAGQLPR